MKNGDKFLWKCLDSISKQTFQDYELVITKGPGIAANTNAAIRKARGEIIKVLFMDDFLHNQNSLREIVDNFSEKDHWLVTGCVDYCGGVWKLPMVPRWHPNVALGDNYIGSPSVLTIRNHHEKTQLFDESLTWVVDCDYYKKMFDRYGPPKVVPNIGVVIVTGDHQATNTICNDEVRNREFLFLQTKYGSK